MCDGSDAVGNDNDGDGFPDIIDCDDNDSSIYPGAPDPVGDGIDQDCDGSDGAVSPCLSFEMKIVMGIVLLHFGLEMAIVMMEAILTMETK